MSIMVGAAAAVARGGAAPVVPSTAFYDMVDFAGTKYFTDTDGINNAFMATAYSISSWFKVSDTGTPQSIVRVSGSGSVDAAVMNDWTTLNASHADVITFAHLNTSAAREPIQTPLSYQDGLLHHVVVTFDGTTGKIFVDGDEKASGAMGIPETNTGVEFSNRHFSGVELFNGEEAVTILHNTDLSTANVTELYNLGKPKPLANYSTAITDTYLPAYPFNSGNLSPFDDAGTGGNDATMFNSATTDGSSVEFDIS